MVAYAVSMFAYVVIMLVYAALMFAYVVIMFAFFLFFEQFGSTVVPTKSDSDVIFVSNC